MLYNECDGAELEASSMVLDLRFIPEDMTFERKLRDEARAGDTVDATSTSAVAAV